MPKDNDGVITMVLLGLNSSDKCLMGNTMLGHNCFQSGKNTYQRALGKTEDGLLYIINTPEFFWRPHQDPETNGIEEMKPSYSGTCMLLIIVQSKPLSEDEMEMLKQLKRRFGEKLKDNSTIVVINDEKESGEGRSYWNQKIIQDFNERVCVFTQDMRGEDLLKKLLLEKQESNPDRVYIDMNKDVHQKVNNEPELTRTTPEESVSVGLLESEGMVMMVLLGMKSEDKCLIGNSILQHDCFMPGRTVCDPVVARVAGRMVCVVNTPDLFVYKPRPDPIADNMEEMQPSYRGPRLFLVILQDRTLSHEEIEMVKDLKERFGDSMLKNTVAIFFISKEKDARELEGLDERMKVYLDECKQKMFVFRADVNCSELIQQLFENQ